MKFKESALAHKYLDGLKGVEIGGAAHNPFGLDTINVDLIEGDKYDQVELCGEFAKVDIIANGDDLPFDDKSFDFVISSHVIEHFFDPIKAIDEWVRVSKEYVFMIVPHKERIFDKDRPLTTLDELIERQDKPMDYEDKHWNVWVPENFKELVYWMGFDDVEMHDPDDKVGNGFTCVIEL